MATPVSRSLSLVLLPGSLLLTTGFRTAVDSMGAELVEERASDGTGDCRARLVRRQSSEYADTICTCMKEGCKGETYTPAKIRGIVLHDKGVDCTISEYSKMCGLDAPAQQAPPPGEQCRAKLEQRVDSDFPKQICECMKEGCDGETYTPAKIRGIVLHDKGVDCTTAEYSKMCGLDTPGQEAPTQSERCRAKLEQRVDSDFPNQICECMKEGCDGETYTPAKVRSLIMEDKGVDCSEDEYSNMCGLDVPSQEAPPQDGQCRAKLEQRVDSNFPRQICECMKEGCDGETYTPAKVRSLIMEDKGVYCSEDEYSNMCGLDVPSPEAPPQDGQCRAKLEQRVDSNFPRQICECLKEGCDGETYTPAKVRGLIMEDKGVDCSEDEYRAMCGL